MCPAKMICKCDTHPILNYCITEIKDVALAPYYIMSNGTELFLK